jgi:folate-binding protein YgfZ
MQTDWQKFLLARSGPTGDGRMVTDTLLTDLSHAGLIRVEGADAVAFLQGQLSTDIEKITSDNCQLSSWNNAKGRVVTLLHLFHHDGAIDMALPAPLVASVLKRLSMYVLRSKVTLTDATDTLARFGVTGAGANALLAKVGIDPPSAVYGVTNHDGVQTIRLHGDVPRYTVKAPVPKLIALWEGLERLGTKPANADAWTLAKIVAGEPSVYPETSEHFVAQMLNLDALGAIDFKKGCYIGQEVIARSHYRGGVKRHMLRGQSSAAVDLKPGLELQAKGGETTVAEIVDAQRDTGGVWQMLLVVQDDFKDAKLTHATSGTAVTLSEI